MLLTMTISIVMKMMTLRVITDDGDGRNDVIESCNCANSAKGSMPVAPAAESTRQLNSNFENLGRAWYWTLLPSNKCPVQYFKLETWRGAEPSTGLSILSSLAGKD